MALMNNIHEAVSIYHSNGMRCMPVHGIEAGCKHIGQVCLGSCFGKVPTEANWPDRKQWFADEFKDGDNIALIMGKQLDGRWFVGFDVDGHLDLSKYMDLPDTMECRTRRGKHLVFEVPAETPLGNWTNALDTVDKKLGYKYGVQSALDLKYCRGAMVSPPSKTQAGDFYQWIRFNRPALLPWEIISYLIYKRRKQYPGVERYYSWSAHPSHAGKMP